MRLCSFLKALTLSAVSFSTFLATVTYHEPLKEPKDMTDYECTLLAGIPNAPSVYSLDVRPDLAKQRQEKVVECMVEVKYITPEESSSILNGVNDGKIN